MGRGDLRRRRHRRRRQAMSYPGDHRARARHGLAELAGSIADLLADMSAGVAKRPTATETELWLARSRALDEEVTRLGPLVDEAVAFLRIDPFARKAGSAELSQALAALVHSVNQVRGIARTLFDHRIEGAPRLPASLAEVLAAPRSPTAPRPTPWSETAQASMPLSRRSAKRASNRSAAFVAWTRRVPGSSPERSSPTSTGWFDSWKVTRRRSGCRAMPHALAPTLPRLRRRSRGPGLNGPDLAQCSRFSRRRGPRVYPLRSSARATSTSTCRGKIGGPVGPEEGTEVTSSMSDPNEVPEVAGVPAASELPTPSVEPGPPPRTRRRRSRTPP